MKVSASGYDSDTCRVPVGTVCPVDPEGDLSASQYRVKQGGTVMLSWKDVIGVHTSCSVVNAPSCALGSVTSCGIPDGFCPSPTINTQTTFTLKCDGVNVDSVTIDVVPDFEPF
jgi:hypothetical protein